jgi:hypothetical protein
MTTDFSSILNDVKSLNNDFELVLPSSNKAVKIKQLTLAQQKKIIETGADNTLSVLFFNTTIYNILENNVQLSTKDMNTIDRVSICISLRYHLLNTIVIDSKQIPLPLPPAISEINKFSLPTVVETEKFKFTLRIPTLYLDNKVNSVLLKKYKDDSIQGNTLKLLVGDLFTHEIVKFIELIEVKSTGNQFKLDNNISDSIKLIEAIDSKEFIDIIK